MCNNDTLLISKRKKAKLIFLYITIIFFMMTINDLPLQRRFGTLCASPTWIVSIVTFLFILVKDNFSIHIDKYSRLFLIFFFITFFISLIQCILYLFFEENTVNNFSISILKKHFLASSYHMIYFLTIWNVNYILQETRTYFLTRSILLVSFLLVIIMVLEYTSPNIFSFLHLNAEKCITGSRLRILSPEPSIAAFTFNIFLLLTITLSNSIFNRFIFFNILLIGNILISSKASLILLIISEAIVFYLNTSFAQKIKLLFILLPTFIVSISISLRMVIPEFFIDIENFSSTSTRLITSLWSICSLFYYPLGEGYGTYKVWFLAPLNIAMTFADKWVPFTLNLSEIERMINTGNYLSAKSGVFFSIIHSGFIAIIFYILLFKNGFYDIQCSTISFYKKFLLRLILWYSLLSLIFAVNTEVLYTFLLPFTIINFFKKKSERNIINGDAKAIIYINVT